MTVAETIREITRRHLLENNGVAMGQCLSAVGWVGGTVPELPGHPNLIELSMDDTSNAGLAVGYATAGRRPIQIIRYQGFMHINQSQIVNYAAKAKELWGMPCPIYVRAIAMDGGIGPVAGNAHHGLITRMPGVKVFAPMSPAEIQSTWNAFMADDEPYYVSEHRRSFSINYEFVDVITAGADLTIFAISASRLDAQEALKLLMQDGISVNLVNVVQLKPFTLNQNMRDALVNSKYGGIVLDDDYVNGAAKSIAYDLMMATSRPIHVLGLEERTAGFAPHLDNLPPSPEKIRKRVQEIVKHKSL